MRVLVIGDSITDEYCYVTPLGKASKENVLATHRQREESFHGGVWAAANHVRSFCKEVVICTGTKDTIKRRYVEENSLRKIYEVQSTRDLHNRTDADISAYDVVIVADFGHGCMTQKMIDRVSAEAQFLAVNAQTNAANHGYNLITKYPKADYIVIDDPEARLAAVDRDGHIEDVISKLAHGRCNKFIVTHGNLDTVGFDGSAFHHLQPQQARAVDTMGAGDAFFAVTAPMAVSGRMEDLLLVGNAAGAIKCGIVGHRASVTKEALMVHLYET